MAVAEANVVETEVSVNRREIVFARLFIGVVVLTSAEVLSGASLRAGLWNPFTVLLTYWLYFAHFFFFTTLAVWTGRTSLPSLYLWGILFGLYEAWITKVIWYGYGASGEFVIGRIGPYGISETSMAFIFHPAMSFILPLAITCTVCPPLRNVFPDLAWFTGASKGARIVQWYLVLSFGPIMAINSGGAVNLILNLAFVTALLWLTRRLASEALIRSDGLQIVAFGRRGFIGLCVYLALLYGVTYPGMHPQGLPSAAVQLVTLSFYGIAILGLWMHSKGHRASGSDPYDEGGARRIVRLFILTSAVALVLAALVRPELLYSLIAANFVVWAVLAVVLTVLALTKGR